MFKLIDEKANKNVQTIDEHEYYCAQGNQPPRLDKIQ